jgi:starch phosphorylase
MPTWDSPMADRFWTNACSQQRWLGTTEDLDRRIRQLPDSAFWELRTAARKSLIDDIRQRLLDQLSVMGAPEAEMAGAKSIFDPDILTLGFGRRFAGYKRPTLLLHNPERLLRILKNPRRPVQLVIAGKAHPADLEGQDMIREWIRFTREPGVQQSAIFLSDYDMSLTAALVQGTDVWINTPRRPWEASGTSGMKVLVNGGLNLSELDGWWNEAYSPEVGWAIGDRKEHDSDSAWDAAEADALYSLIESEIVPEFYTRNDQGIPVAWVARVRESMARLTPRFSAVRTVQEYTEQYYLPAAQAYQARAADGGARGKQIADWIRELERDWPKLRFGQVDVTTDSGQHHFEIQIYLDGLDPDSVRVELYAEPARDVEAVRHEIVRGRKLVGTQSGYVYSGDVPASRPAAHYTARILPRCDDVSTPLETNRILWHH